MIVPSTNYGLMAKARTSPIYDDFEKGSLRTLCQQLC